MSVIAIYRQLRGFGLTKAITEYAFPPEIPNLMSTVVSTSIGVLVEEVRFVLPLLDCVDSSRDKQGMPGHWLNL